jgi:hypothetical protein
MKQKQEIKTGDVILMVNQRGDTDCVLVLGKSEKGLKILINSKIREYKTEDYKFNNDSILSLES